MADQETIVAIATAPGRGGIGVLRLSGNNLEPLVTAVCGRSLQPRLATLCPFRSADGEVIDKGIALYFPAPHSYTGEDVLELQGHGGSVVLQQLLKRCLALGARLAEPGEFSKRAFLNGKLDLAQAEGVADLIDAATEEAARCASRTLRGEFSAAIGLVAGQLLELRALTEATLDFPEEEIDSGTREDQAQRLTRVREGLEKLLAMSTQGSLLREGVVVVLAGQPNVGKSSLLNRLAGDDVAIVTEVPGTTRDTIRQTINLQGVPVHLIDTAGLRDTVDTVEQHGISRTWLAIQRSDLAILVIDAVRGETPEDETIRRKLPKDLRYLKVYNKSDLAGLPNGSRTEAGETAVVLSAKTGEGVDVLQSTLAQAIGWQGGTEGVFMASARHLQALSTCQSSLIQAFTHLARQELFAEDLRKGHEALMSITGTVTADDLLGEIFSRFCIGK